MDSGAEREVIEIRGSRRFEIRLQSNPSSGAAWELVTELRQATLVAKTVEAEGNAPGDPWTTRFVFDAAQGGEILLQFHLKRPWETASRREKEILVRIVE